MKRFITVLALGSIGFSFAVVGVTAPTSSGTSLAAPKPKPTPTCPSGTQRNAQNRCVPKCPPGWYKNHPDWCFTIPSHGVVQVSVPKIGVSLSTVGNQSTSGTRIVVSRVTIQHPHRTGHTFKVFATGKMPALTLTKKGTLYGYATKTNTWSKIATITQPGIYEAVYA